MIAFVAVGYNRADSMRKLLNSLAKVDCDGDCVDLFISIDKGPKQQLVIDVATNYIWENGKKEIRAFSERQGLMRHILQCGALTNQYDAVIVLEDDLVVSSECYRYVKQAIDYYKNDNRVAGISLYSYRINEYVSRPFEPAYSDSDAYMMQVAQSWGQCWTRDMWNDFIKWEGWNKEVFEFDDLVPENVNNWKKTSWKKNYARYVIKNGKYFLYPYQSLSTNCSEAGEHWNLGSDHYQVQLLNCRKDWKFKSFEECIKYDGFFERQDINCNALDDKTMKICMDLYGKKMNYEGADVLISTKALPYSIIKEIALKYKPHEVNLETPEEGKGIYIYNLASASKKHKANKLVIAHYDIGAVRWRYTISHGINGFLNTLKNRVFK